MLFTIVYSRILQRLNVTNKDLKILAMGFWHEYWLYCPKNLGRKSYTWLWGFIITVFVLTSIWYWNNIHAETRVKRTEQPNTNTVPGKKGLFLLPIFI